VPYTLLLADDSVTIQRVIELTFADEDVTVVAVSDGDQAIERLEASPPDIVLADIGMPGKNGYEVAQYIRRSPRLAHIPVVLLTGAFEPVDQARANDAGCDGVLAKPFEPQLVISRVKELLSRARRVPAAQSPTPGPVGTDDDLSVPSFAALTGQPQDHSWAPAREEAASTRVETPAAGNASGPMAESQLNDYFDRLDAAFTKIPPAAPSPPPALAAIPDPPQAEPEADINWFSRTEVEIGSAEPWDVPPPPADEAPLDLPLTYASPQPESPVALSQPPESFADVSSVEPLDTTFQIVEGSPVVDPASRRDAAPIGERATVEQITSIGPADERLAPIEESAPVQSNYEWLPAAEPVRSALTAPAEQVTPWPTAAPAMPAPPAAPALELPLPNPPPLPALADAFAALLAAEQADPAAAGVLWPAVAPPAPAPPTPPAPAVVSEEIIEEITSRVLGRLSDTVVREAVGDIASRIAERLVREEIERIRAAIK
jgi:CheY-like chemotaxis protein